MSRQALRKRPINNCKDNKKDENASINGLCMELNSKKIISIDVQTTNQTKIHQSHRKNDIQSNRNVQIEHLTLFKGFNPDKDFTELDLAQNLASKSHHPIDIFDYISIPPHNTYDIKLLKFHPYKQLTKLYFTRQAAKAFLCYGYGERQFKIFTRCSEEIKKKYPTFIYQVIRLVIKQVEGYLIGRGFSEIQGIDFRGVNTLSMPLFRARQNFDMKFCQTYFAVICLIFRIQNIQQPGLTDISTSIVRQNHFNAYQNISQSQILKFYSKLRQKIQQRSHFRQFSKGENSFKSSSITCEHYIYSEGLVPQQFGNQNGINGLGDLFIRNETESLKSYGVQKEWSYEFTIQFLKLYIQKCSLPKIRDTILQRFGGDEFKRELDLKYKLKGRFENLMRRMIKKCQQDFRMCSLIDEIRSVNFYQMKFMSLNDSQIRVLVFREQGLEVRKCMIDYWMNNQAKISSDVSEDRLKYKLTYLNYIVEGVAELLEMKKHLTGVLKETSGDKAQNYDLDAIRLSRTDKKVAIEIDEQSEQVGEYLFKEMWRIKGSYNKGSQSITNYVTSKNLMLNEKIKLMSIKIQPKIQAVQKKEKIESEISHQSKSHQFTSINSQPMSEMQTPIKLQYSQNARPKLQDDSNFQVQWKIREEDSLSVSTLSIEESDEQKWGRKQKKIVKQRKTTKILQKCSQPKNTLNRQRNSSKFNRKNTKQANTFLDDQKFILRYEQCLIDDLLNEKIQTISSNRNESHLVVQQLGSEIQKNTNSSGDQSMRKNADKAKDQFMGEKIGIIEKIEKKLNLIRTVDIKIEPSITKKSKVERQIEQQLKSQGLRKKYENIRQGQMKKHTIRDLFTIQEEDSYDNIEGHECYKECKAKSLSNYGRKIFAQQNMGSRFYRPNKNVQRKKFSLVTNQKMYDGQFKTCK